LGNSVVTMSMPRKILPKSYIKTEPAHMHNRQVRGLCVPSLSD
jgi:hypothetical protein